MAKPYVWGGIKIGIFFAGIGIGYFVSTNMNNPSNMTQNPQHMQQMANMMGPGMMSNITK